ncbi:MAG TPA: hypothetical protein VF533_16190 [Solirubrobacteraceae bacterium]|jgi:hypothetical protein
MKTSLALLCAVAVLVFPASPAAAAGDGALSQLGGKAGCLSVVKEKGCGRLRPKARKDQQAAGWSVAPDARSAVGVVNEDAVVALRRGGKGALRQIRGGGGCIAPRREKGCTVDKRVGGAVATHLSPDGRLVAVTGYTPRKSDPYVLLLRRDPSTGALGKGASGACVTTGTLAGCAKAWFPAGSVGPVAFGAEGRSLYFAASGTLASFALDTAAGTLSQPSGSTPCFVDTNPAAAPCETAPGLNDDSGADEITIPSDGRALYVRTPGRLNPGTGDGSSGSIAAFTRDPATGGLTTISAPGGCYQGRNPDLDPDPAREAICTQTPLDPEFIGSFVAVGNTLVADGSVLFTKDEAGRLAPAATLKTRGIAETGTPVRFGSTLTYPSGLFDENGDPSTGFVATIGFTAAGEDATSLSQPSGKAGCVASRSGGADGCRGPVRGLEGPTALAISPDGKNAYVFAGKRLITLRRDAATGALSPVSGRAGCASAKGGKCSRTTKLRSSEAQPDTLVVSPDGRRVTLLGKGVWTFKRR